MARIRTIKPEFFKHEALYDLEEETGLPIRVAFAGLWTCCDREGRFEWRPRRLKVEILPYDSVDMARVLDALVTRGFIVKYTHEGREYGAVPSWSRHQVINNRESQSELPAPPENIDKQQVLTREARDDDAWPTREVHAQAEGKGKEGKGREGDTPSGGASAPCEDLDKLLYERGKSILGKSAGGQITKLRKSCGSVGEALEALDVARKKESPAEYVAGIIRSKGGKRVKTREEMQMEEAGIRELGKVPQ